MLYNAYQRFSELYQDLCLTNLLSDCPVYMVILHDLQCLIINRKRGFPPPFCYPLYHALFITYMVHEIKC